MSEHILMNLAQIEKYQTNKQVDKKLALVEFIVKCIEYVLP